MSYCSKEISITSKEKGLNCKEISNRLMFLQQKDIEIRNSLTVKEAKIFIRI